MHSAATISAVDIPLVEPASLEDLSQISNYLRYLMNSSLGFPNMKTKIIWVA